MAVDTVNFEFQLPAGLGEMILRLAMIVFAALGIVYLFGRLLPTKLKDKGKNIIAVLALFFISFAITLTYNPAILDTGLRQMANSQLYFYAWDIFLYFTISCVFYVTVGWRFYSRIDNFLDRKIGEDKFRRSYSKKKEIVVPKKKVVKKKK